MSAPAEWHQDFFTGLIVEAQKQLNSDSQTQLEADFLQKQFQLPPGSRIADVPCGNGRLSLALAKQGYEVIGIDGSDGLLRAARDSATESQRVEFVKRDMRDLPWEAHFDGVFCMGNSFAYFDDEGNRRFLSAVHRSLKPGGRFILETSVAAESVLPSLVSGRWYPFGDLYFLHETRFDPITSQLTSSYTLIRNGEIEKKQAVYRVYGCRELLKLAESVGFKVKETFGGLAGESYKLGSPRLFLVLEK